MRRSGDVGGCVCVCVWRVAETTWGSKKKICERGEKVKNTERKRDGKGGETFFERNAKT